MLKTIGKPEGARIVVCCGSGGVGKTTTSAAIGLYGAIKGLKTVVLTIDPARRLADSLGISEFNQDAQKVPIPRDISAKGELYAMMLDAKRTFDRLITRYTSETMAERILANRYYQHLSANMAGSHEYMALEYLYEIYNEGAYDLIILDTPPSRRALDFLDAPARVKNLLGHQYFMKLFKPYMRVGKWGAKLFSVMASPILRSVRQIIGQQTMEDLFSFFKLWDDVLFEGFKQRAQAVERMLADPATVFFAIATPQTIPIRGALDLYRRLDERKMPFGGFIVNRVHRLNHGAPQSLSVSINGDTEDVEDRPVDDKVLLEKLKVAHERLDKLAQSDAEAVSWLASQVGAEMPVREVPYADLEINDIAGLVNVCRHLADDPEEIPPDPPFSKGGVG